MTTGSVDVAARLAATEEELALRTAERDEARRQAEYFDSLINTPRTDDWLEAVRLEAAHQVHRWGTEHDNGKAHSDWFWLVGHLVGKAVTAAILGDIEKAKHHTISTGAALLNWHRRLSGACTGMRAGIETPE